MSFVVATVLAAFVWVRGSCTAVSQELLDDASCAMQMSLRAQGTIAECDDNHVKIPEDRYILTNNLGGQGPDEGPPVIHISPMMVDTVSKRSLDLIISNLTPYSPANSTKNGFFFGDFLSLNIDGFVELLFTFKESGTGKNITMPPFNLTIYDIDGPLGEEDAETVTLSSPDILSYMVTGTTQVSVTEHAGTTNFQSTSYGSRCDNPVSMESLGIKQCKGEIVDQFSRAVAVQMRGGMNTYRINLRVKEGVKTGRNFFFGLPVYFERLCRAGPTSAPTKRPTMHPTIHPTAAPTTIPPPTPNPTPTSSFTPKPPPASTTTTTSTTVKPPSTSAPLPSTSVTPQSTSATPMSTSVTTPSTTVTPPSNTAEPPSTPSTTAKTTPASSSTTAKPISATPTASPSGASAATPAPTKSPTSDSATAFGDPHVGNVRGDSFEILQPGYHNFLVIPRGTHDSGSLLHVRAKVEPLGQLCSGLLYVTTLVFKGEWLGAAKALQFSTNITGDMDASKAINIKVGGSAQPYLTIPEFQQQFNKSMMEVAVLKPAQAPKILNQHVTTLLVKLRLGPSTTRVRMVYQKEKGGFSNSLWLTTTGLRHVEREIGGILGLDDHTMAANKPRQCKGDSMRADARQSRIHAWSSLNDSDES